MHCPSSQAGWRFQVCSLLSKVTYRRPTSSSVLSVDQRCCLFLSSLQKHLLTGFQCALNCSGVENTQNETPSLASRCCVLQSLTRRSRIHDDGEALSCQVAPKTTFSLISCIRGSRNYIRSSRNYIKGRALNSKRKKVGRGE